MTQAHFCNALEYVLFDRYLQIEQYMNNNSLSNGEFLTRHFQRTEGKEHFQRDCDLVGPDAQHDFCYMFDGYREVVLEQNLNRDWLIIDHFSQWLIEMQIIRPSA